MKAIESSKDMEGIENAINERRIKMIYFSSPDMRNFFLVDSDDCYPLRIKDNDLPDDHVVLSMVFAKSGIWCVVASSLFEPYSGNMEIIRKGEYAYNVHFIESGRLKLRIE